MRSQSKAGAMTMKLVEQSEAFNKFKWLAVIVLLTAGVVANYYFSQIAWPLRLLAWLFGLPIVALVAFQTQQGRQFLEFIRNARVELRKITWPTRQETVQTTFIIAVVVVVISIALWGVDGILMWLIGWLTGQRG